MCVLWRESEKKLTTFSYEEDDKYLIVENVPAEVCTKCGEKMYSPEVTDELLKFARINLSQSKSYKSRYLTLRFNRRTSRDIMQTKKNQRCRLQGPIGSGAGLDGRTRIHQGGIYNLTINRDYHRN